MKPTFLIITGFAFVLAPFWAQYLGFQISAIPFSFSYLLGLGIWAFGYYQIMQFGSARDLNIAFALGLVLFSAMPPEISKDIYIYILEGKLALSGYTSYIDASVNLKDPFYVYTDPHWLDCPNQYGPVALFFFQVVAFLGGDHVFMNIFWMKALDVASALGIFFILKYAAASLRLSVVRAQALVCLNPLFLIQGLGQMHIDFIACVMVCLFMYAIVRNQLVWAGVLTALLGATKFMLFPLFWLLILVYSVYAWQQKIFSIKAFAVAVCASFALFAVVYWPVWQGIETILIPMAYHEKKEPVKSIVELLSYGLAFFWPQDGADYNWTDPFIKDKIFWGQQLKRFFQVLALILAAKVTLTIINAKSLSQLFYGFSRIMLLVFILYTPVMHAWYFLFVLPFFALTEHQKEIIWYTVCVFTLANAYEIGLTVGTTTGKVLMILFTVLSVLSYFMYFRKFYLQTLTSSESNTIEELEFVARKHKTY